MSPRDRTRPWRLRVLAMLLVTLAGSLLYSAGAEHHARSATSTATSTAEAPTGSPAAEAPGHHHHHGAEWTPTLTCRARPSGESPTASAVGADIAGAASRPPIGRTPLPRPSGVLRV